MNNKVFCATVASVDAKNSVQSPAISETGIPFRVLILPFAVSLKQEPILLYAQMMRLIQFQERLNKLMTDTVMI
jgi:hypothetical protein